VIRRRSHVWLAVLSVGLAVGLCVVLYRRTGYIDLRAYAGLKGLLQRVRQLDSDLGKGVLASRYGLVNQYDALTRSDAELDACRLELRPLLSGAVSADARTDRAVTRLEQAERTLRSDVELFKTQNSVLKNSLLYLPAAGDSLVVDLWREQQAPEAQQLQTAIHGLVRSTLIYNIVPSGTLRDSLSVEQTQLAASGDAVPPGLRAELAQFLKHATTVSRQQDVVDPLVARISSGALSRAASELETLSDELLEREQARADRVRVALDALVVVLIGALSVIGYKLKRLYVNLEQQVRDRTQKLAEEKLALQLAEHHARLNEARTNAVIEGAREGIVRLAPNGHIRSWNPAAAHMFEASWSETQGLFFVELAVLPEAQHGFLAWLSRADTDGRIDQADYWHELPLVSSTKRIFSAECSVARRDPAVDDEITLFVRDISEAKQLEAELRQAQKLESVGRLASGIAHEINTPIQFVSDSCFFVREAFTTMAGLVRGYAALLGRAATGDSRQALLADAAALEEEADLSYLLSNAPKSIETMVDGLSRVAELVAGMKTFAHPDQKEQVPVDLNHALKSTLTIACNEYKYVADVETDLVTLPNVVCHAGEVNQVILNILVNAAHAVAERVKGTDERGLIALRTRVEGESVVISIADTGAGIPAEIRSRIFDPFFTTKDVGKGTGQGLAIARSVIVDKHGGDIGFETEVGKGTTFHVRLPIAGRAQQARNAA
jgi:signal transduction histidine kinase